MGYEMRSKLINNYDKPIPIILGWGINGLGLVRSFGFVKVPVICLDTKKSLVFYSKYSKSYFRIKYIYKC